MYKKNYRKYMCTEIKEIVKKVLKKLIEAIMKNIAYKQIHIIESVQYKYSYNYMLLKLSSISIAISK